MYKCDKHGEHKTDWCDWCSKILICDCSDQTYTRFKDLFYDCEGGERTVTIRLYHCNTCGIVSHAEI